jgi:hypothetical protein
MGNERMKEREYRNSDTGQVGPAGDTQVVLLAITENPLIHIIIAGVALGSARQSVESSPANC